jgi:hypothetical protein
LKSEPTFTGTARKVVHRIPPFRTVSAIKVAIVHHRNLAKLSSAIICWRFKVSHTDVHAQQTYSQVMRRFETCMRSVAYCIVHAVSLHFAARSSPPTRTLREISCAADHCISSPVVNCTLVLNNITEDQYRRHITRHLDHRCLADVRP